MGNSVYLKGSTRSGCECLNSQSTAQHRAVFPELRSSEITHTTSWSSLTLPKTSLHSNFRSEEQEHPILHLLLIVKRRASFCPASAVPVDVANAPPLGAHRPGAASDRLALLVLTCSAPHMREHSGSSHPPELMPPLPRQISSAFGVRAGSPRPQAGSPSSPASPLLCITARTPRRAKPHRKL